MIRDEQIARLMAVGAGALLLGALAFQFLNHLPPCEMCHWQRWPYFAVIAIALAAPLLRDDKRLVTVAAILLTAVIGMFIAGQMAMAAAIGVAALLLAALAALKPGARHMALVTIVLVAASGLIGAYQTGLQWGLLPGPGACTVAHAYVMGSGAPAPDISCNAVTWSLFGLSLAAYNALLAFIIAGTGAFLLSRNHAA
jgi:disulfide bond formation protein DsbB